MFQRDDFARLAALLETLRGRFLLSINDLPETRRIFAAFAVESVATTYRISGIAQPGRRELLVSSRAR